jgi:dihydroorotase
MSYDIVIRGGEVIDPSQGMRQVCDVAVSGGKVAAVQESIDCSAATTVIDARGQLVTPGLIDLHVHVYPHAPLGLDPDSLCASGGVTTMLDAGTAGSYNFDAFRRDTIDRAETQIFSLVNLSCIGLIAANLGELLDRRYADPDGVVATIERNRDVAVGVKIRAGAHIIGAGEQGWANLKDAIRAARESNTWLMVHIGESPMSIPELAEALSPGDCITHCFKAGSTRITDDAGQVFDGIKAAAERGIMFDVGHGYGSFNWEVVQNSLDCGLEPTTISTDIHAKNIHGPVYDMPTTMSKFLMLGVPLERVIEMSTTTPARVLKQEGELGTLRVGSVADIAVLERLTGDFVFTDSYRQQKTGSELLVASTTVRRGEIVPGGAGRRMQHLPE